MLELIGKLEGVEYLIYGFSFLIVILLAFTFHEFAHAFVAYKQGDITPKVHGRVSINPLNHIDPLGFILCFLFGVGWAKPVQVNPLNFKQQRKGMALVSISGVIANLIMAFVGCGCAQAILRFGNLENTFVYFLFVLFLMMFQINISLFVFNLLPIPPLDGFNLILTMAKPNSKFLSFMQKYGFVILLIMLFFLGFVFSYIVEYVGYPISAFWQMIFF